MRTAHVFPPLISRCFVVYRRSQFLEADILIGALPAIIKYPQVIGLIQVLANDIIMLTVPGF